MILSVVNRDVGLLRKFQNLLPPQNALITVYKSFIRPRLDYSDIIYEQTYNYSFHQNIESKHDNACFSITRAISGTTIPSLV